MVGGFGATHVGQVYVVKVIAKVALWAVGGFLDVVYRAGTVRWGEKVTELSYDGASRDAIGFGDGHGDQVFVVLSNGIVELETTQESNPTIMVAQEDVR